MWNIYLFFYVYSVASLISQNPDDGGAQIDNSISPSLTEAPLSGNNWTNLDLSKNCSNEYPCFNCTEMTLQPCGNTSLWRSISLKLGENGSFIETIMLGNSNCSENMNWTESIFLAVEAIGELFLDVNNNTWPESGFETITIKKDTIVSGDVVVTDNDMSGTNTDPSFDQEIYRYDSRWFHVGFMVKSFNVTILNETDFYFSNVTDFYYQNMTDLFVNNMTEGYCMPILDYFNNQTFGCPCTAINGTWNTTGYWNATAGAFMGGREIVPYACGNDSCREAFFLNDTMKRANMRVNLTEYNNGTVFKTIEITKSSFDIGEGYTYGVQDIAYVFGAWEQKNIANDQLVGENVTDVPVVVIIPPEQEQAPVPEQEPEPEQQPEQEPEPVPIPMDNDRNDTNTDDVYGSNAVGLPISTFITMISIFLLSMIHHN